jgi:Tat protein translocase TatC
MDLTETAQDDQPLPLAAHLEELRRRLIVVLLAVAAAFVAAWFLREPMMALMVWPHAMTMRSLGLPEKLIQFRYPEGFFAFLTLCLVGAVVLASPVILYQAWAYVRVALGGRERALVRTSAVVSVGLFVAGVAFGLLALVPLGLRFMILVTGPAAQPMIGLGDYLSLVIALTLVTGLVFETPLLIRFLVGAGLVEWETLSRSRRPAILAIFIIAAVLTPPDPFTQVLLALPMWGLYELGLVLARPTRRGVWAAAGLTLAAAGLTAGLVGWLRPAAAAPEEGRALDASSATTPLEASVRGGRLTLRPGAKALAPRYGPITLLQGEVLVSVASGQGPVRVRTRDGEVAVFGGEADVALLDAETRVTALTGDVRTVFGGVEGQVAAGRMRRFSALGEPVVVQEVTSWAADRKP